MHDNQLSSPVQRSPRRLMATCALAMLVAAGAAADARAQAGKKVAPAPEAGSDVTKVLRYVSLKADRVPVREGPGTNHPVAWIFQRTGLPVEVIREFEVWRQIRDAGGTVGWVHSSLLSSRRTALVLPWAVKEGPGKAPLATLRDGEHEQARAVAQVEAGVLASIISCRNGWCRVSVADHRGYIEQTKLWGTYPNEKIN